MADMMQLAGTAALPPTEAVRPSNEVRDAISARNQRILEGRQVTPDTQKLKSIGALLLRQFKDYESYRKLAELRWTRNLRQFLGEYDPDINKNLDPNRSKAYPRMTRWKVVSMVARLMSLLFPTTEKNWGIGPSPVPNLSMEDLQNVLAQALAGVQGAQEKLTDEVIEGAIRAFAQKRADNLELEIEDQLAELGGSRALPYVSLARKVLYSGVLYGLGVLKGPFARQQTQRTWDRSTGQLVPKEIVAFRPHFEFVSVWDYYPDMSAKHMASMEGQYHRLVLSAQQLREIAERPGFRADVIKEFIARTPKGNWRERTYEAELRSIGVQTNVNVLAGSKFEVLVWDGLLKTVDLIAAGIETPDSYDKDLVETSFWMLGDEVIKAEMSAWAELEPEQRISMYHHFIFEEDDSNLLGNGLPNIMRDSQMGLSAATRMLMDNASVVCGPMLEVNRSLLRADQDMTKIVPYKIWYREDEGSDAQIQAVRPIEVPNHIDDLSKIVQLMEHFADQETFINPATGGDLEKMPSEPFRSAAGASMMRGDIALPFKDAVRNFDTFTISFVSSLILFNKHFNPNPELQGDFSPIARGASSLMAKEVRGMALDMLSQTLRPEETKYINWYASLKEKLRVRDVDLDQVVVDADTAKQIDAQEQAQAQQDKADMRELLLAEMRKLLADAAKSLTQSDANSAKAEAALAKAVADGLSQGITPTDVHAARAGGELPPAVAAGFRRTSGTDRPEPASTKH